MRLESMSLEKLRNILIEGHSHLRSCSPEQWKNWNKYALIVAIRATQGEQAKDYLTQGCTIDYIIAQEPTGRYYKVINDVLHYKDSDNYEWVEAASTLKEHTGCNFVVVKY